MADYFEFRACLAGRCLCSQNIYKYSNKPAKGYKRIIRRSLVYVYCLIFITCLFTFLFSLHWNENTEPKIIKSLGRLALHNDTLLDLSGEHFNLTDFLPASALLSPKALSPLEEGDAAAAADPRQVRF